MDVTGFGAGDFLKIEKPSVASGDVQVVFSTGSLNQAGVAVNVGSSVETTGPGILADRDGNLQLGFAGTAGVCAIIVEGKLYARIALHVSSFSVADCFALPLPLYAYREGEQVQPLSIVNNFAGWAIYSPSPATRIVGFNLPTALRYHEDSSDTEPLNANGGDFGIEFTTPETATSIVIFNGSYWLALDER